MEILQATPARVIVLPDDKITKTSSGLYTGKYSLEGALRRGTVLSVGRDIKEVQPGDRVAFNSYDGQGFTYKNTRYVKLWENEILGKLSNEHNV